MEYAELNNGCKLPLLGYGTWQSKDDTELSVALRSALDNGYRLIDTAHLYQNEHIIGKVLEEYLSAGKLKREDLFITSKLPFTGHAAADVATVVKSQLKNLQLEYIDLYLIHCPCPYKRQENSFAPVIENGKLVPTTTPHMETWKELEKLHEQGLLKAIGLSNFNEEQIRAIHENAQVKPANLQVECHVYLPQFELQAACKELGMTFTAYAPLGSPGRKAARPDGLWPEGDPMSDDRVKAIAAAHHKTPAQVLLRHLIQRGISVIPKSIQPDRVVENISIFDFKLTDEEMNKLNSVPERIRLFIGDIFADHPFFHLKGEVMPRKNSLHLH